MLTMECLGKNFIKFIMEPPRFIFIYLSMINHIIYMLVFYYVLCMLTMECLGKNFIKFIMEPPRFIYILCVTITITTTIMIKSHNLHACFLLCPLYVDHGVPWEKFHQIYNGTPQVTNTHTHNNDNKYIYIYIVSLIIMN